jgi:hypothetical protein
MMVKSAKAKFKKRTKFNGDNKKIKNATKLEIDGIKFKSNLEAYCYKHLKEADIDDFQYEQIKFVLQEPFTFSNSSVELYERTVDGKKVRDFGEVTSNIRAITYTPDFVMIRPDKTGYVIETKGFRTDQFTLKWKMFKNYLETHGYKLSLYAPNNQNNVNRCIQSIKSRYYL